MNHEMSLREIPFDRIKSGRKVIEVRLFDEKRQKVQIGDTITFSKVDHEDETITVEVIGLSRFKNFRDFYSAFDKSKFGHSEQDTLEDQIRRERGFYSEEKEKKYGVLGIHIKLI